MNVSNVASEIRDALGRLPGREFSVAATELLGVLGYRSDLLPEFSVAATELLGVLGYRSDLLPDSQPATVDDFIRQHPATTPDTKTEQSLKDSVVSIHVLFQFTDQEIGTQGSLFKIASFDTGNARSFLFTAVELEAGSYSRGDYATFAREINKRWQLPTVVLFKTASNLLTLAFVHRRPNKRDPARDVLGSVSLIREIGPSAPHRAHLDILAELSLARRLSWMNLRRPGRTLPSQPARPISELRRPPGLLAGRPGH